MNPGPPPRTPNRLWTYQEYANSPKDGEWCTGWASFQFYPLQAPLLNDIRPATGACLFDATGLVVGVDYLVQSTTDLTSGERTGFHCRRSVGDFDELRRRFCTDVLPPCALSTAARHWKLFGRKRGVGLHLPCAASSINIVERRSRFSETPNCNRTDTTDTVLERLSG
jgi:hypothetical protein